MCPVSPTGVPLCYYSLAVSLFILVNFIFWKGSKKKINDRFSEIPKKLSKLFPSFVSSNYFNSSVGKVHYLSGGSGDPVVFIHGNPAWAVTWRKVMGNLNPVDHFVIAPDLMSMGFSGELPKKKFNIESHVAAIYELIGHLNLKDITLVVQDWGGPIGMSVAEKLKDKIKGVVILNTGLAVPNPKKISKFHKSVHKKLIPDLLFNFFGYPMYSLGTLQADPNSIGGQIAKAYRWPIRIFERWHVPLKFARMVPAYVGHPSLGSFQLVENYCRTLKKPVELSLIHI